MEKRHIQVKLTVREYEVLRRASRKAGLTMKEALREAAIAWARGKARKDDPVLRLVTLAKGPRNASRIHDQDYDEA